MDQVNNSQANQADSRAQFEAWAFTRGMPIHRRDFPESEKHGQYGNAYTHDAWLAWQAALAARQPVAKEAMCSDLSGYAVAASQVRRGYDVECVHCGNFCDTGDVGPCQPVSAAIKDSLTVGGGRALGQEPVPFAVESKAFEAHAASRKLDLSQHPLHYLFLDRVADEARQAWKAALAFAPATQAVDLEQQQDAARWRAIAPHLQVEWDEDELLKRWTWIDFKRDALSVPTRSRESYASLNDAMDAVIDSQAVGNG